MSRRLRSLHATSPPPLTCFSPLSYERAAFSPHESDGETVSHESAVETPPQESNGEHDNYILSDSSNSKSSRDDHLSAEGSDEDGLVEPPTKSWPKDFFTRDIIRGFAEIDAGLAQKRPLAEIFREFFGVEIKGTTYHDHRARWNDVSVEAKEQALALRREKPKGLWSSFMHANPSKAAYRRAIQRKAKAKQ